MAMIQYRTLNSELRKALRGSAIPVGQLPELYDRVKASQESEKKDLRISYIVLGVLAVLLVGYCVYTQVNAGADVMTALPSAGLVAVFTLLLFPLVYFLNVGLFALQFNLAMKKGYPDLADRYKL